MAYNAIDGFLHNSNYAFTELNGRSNRAAILIDFVNYVLDLNAAAWVQKEDFLTSREIKTIWGKWFRSRPASLLAIVNNDSTAAKNVSGGQGVLGANNSGGGSGRRRGRGRGWPRQNQSATTSGQFSAPPPHVASSGQGSSGGGGGNQMLCLRFNYGNCPNSPASCALPSGTRLYHRCDALLVNGSLCNNAGHPRIHHI
jgi:hypothetical protein